MRLGTWIGLALGIVMFVAGGLLAFQGLGWIDGGWASGVQFWATSGPLLAGLGVALAWVSVRGTPK